MIEKINYLSGNTPFLIELMGRKSKALVREEAIKRIFYNLKRPHSSLDKMTPDEFYYDQLPQQNKVA